MTVASTTNRADRTITSGTTSYPYAFRIFADADLSVVRRHPTTGAETALVLNTDYSVTGAGNANGGTIVISSGNATTYNGYGLTIRRVLGTTQSTSIRNQGAFYPEVHEDVFDRLSMVDQQQQEEIDRSVKLPETVAASEFDPTLPAGVTAGAGRTLLVNATGDGFDMGPTATEISSAQSAATAALAALDSFDDRYLGAKSSDPTLDNDGNALLTGALYWNTTTSAMRAYSGTKWTEFSSVAYVPSTYSGDGVTTAFALPVAPVSKNNVFVTIGGVSQSKSKFSVSGSTLTFVSAPPAGTDNIEFIVAQPLPVASADAANVTYLSDGSGAQQTTLGLKLRGFVQPEDFGGTTVTNSIIMAMNQAAAIGVPLRCSPVDYPTDTAVIPPAGLEWYANGCRIVANTDISTSAVRIVNNDVRIRGLLRIQLSDIAGTPSAYRGFVLVGDWMDATIAPTNFKFDDLYFEGGHANVNGLAIAGGANRIRGKSVRCGDSTKIGRLFMPHWGNFNHHYNSGGTYQHAAGAAPTTHPHDIIIDEVSAGNLTCSTSDFMAIVAISAGYDIEIGKVSGTVNGTGASAGDMVLLTAGDLGFAYASASERSSGMWGIRIKAVVGQAKGNGIKQIGQALYYNADSTPQPTSYYFAKIEDTIDYAKITVTGTAPQVLAMSNGYGKSRYGVINATGGVYCASTANYTTDVTIDVLRCNNSLTKALLVAGSGGDSSIFPNGIEIKTLEINGTAANGSGTQADSIGFLIQSANRVRIGTVRANSLANNGYAGAINTNVNSISIGETFLASNYNAALSFAYTNSAGYTDFVSIGNVFGPTTVTQAISGGTTFRTMGRNREFYSAGGFLAGMSVNNGDRTWITAGSGPALTQVKTSGLIGSTAVTKDQLTYT